MKKANHFLNVSATENPLPKKLVRNKEILRKFFIKCTKLRSFQAPLKMYMKPREFLKSLNSRTGPEYWQ